MFDPPRLKHRDLKAEQVQPLDRSIPGAWPETWREVALSFFITLLSLPNWRQLSEEQLAMRAAAGVGEDLGGTQPYIPVGERAADSTRREVVLGHLKKGMSYREAARATGLTENRVRKIELEDRKDRKQVSAKPS
jgi:Mor family transcriptional regulator